MPVMTVVPMIAKASGNEGDYATGIAVAYIPTAPQPIFLRFYGTRSCGLRATILLVENCRVEHG